jgi:hypothetical protein
MLENVKQARKTIPLTLELHGELRKLRRETGMSYYRLADELVRLGLAAWRAGQRSAPVAAAAPDPAESPAPAPTK